MKIDIIGSIVLSIICMIICSILNLSVLEFLGLALIFYVIYVYRWVYVSKWERFINMFKRDVKKVERKGPYSDLEI